MNINFLNGIDCVQIKYISSLLLTTKLDTKKGKSRSKKQIVAFVIMKPIFKFNK